MSAKVLVKTRVQQVDPCEKSAFEAFGGLRLNPKIANAY
jgi:hypothetical protein